MKPDACAGSVPSALKVAKFLPLYPLTHFRSDSHSRESPSRSSIQILLIMSILYQGDAALLGSSVLSLICRSVHNHLILHTARAKTLRYTQIHLRDSRASCERLDKRPSWYLNYFLQKPPGLLTRICEAKKGWMNNALCICSFRISV